MHKNNMCVIYDSDTKYAMKLMSVINSDKQIPFGAQVFTEQDQLQSYLKDYEPKILMVSEDIETYKLKEDLETKLVVLCDEEERVEQAVHQYGEQAIGVYKYQPSNRILQQIIHQGLDGGRPLESMKTKVIGVAGADVCSRNLLSITLSYLMGEKESVLYVNLDEFSGLEHILPDAQNVNLSDAFYIYKQNGYRYCDEIRKTIYHTERIDYIAPVQCAEDISYMEPTAVVQFIMGIGEELGYSMVIVDISSGVRASWHILEKCELIYVPKPGNDLLQRKQKAMERYFLETGMEYVVDKMIQIPVQCREELMHEGFWKEIEYSQNTRNIKELLCHGYNVS